MSEPAYFLRRAGSRDYVRTDDGENFDVTASRDRASAFCSHSAQHVREHVEELTGVRYRLVLAGYLGQATHDEPASVSIDALATAPLH